MPRVLNIRDCGYKVPEGAVYCGRAAPRYQLKRSKWANPFPVIHHTNPSIEMERRRKSIDAYVTWLTHGPLSHIEELRGLDLVCWCAPLLCHCDVLLELANKKGNNLLDSGEAEPSQYRLVGGAGGEYPFDRGKHLIVAVALRAYADESGTHNDPSYCIVAGWIGNPRRWRVFQEEWNDVIHNAGIEEFHSKVFFSRKVEDAKTNPYHDWSDERALGFISALAGAISKRLLYPVGMAVNVKAFMSYSEGERRYFTGAIVRQSGRFTRLTGTPNKPYHLAVPCFFDDAVDHAKSETQVHFIFDRNDVEEKYVLRAYNEMRDKSHYPKRARLGELTFADRKDEPGLQAADLYAHLWWAFLEYGSMGMGVEKNRVWQLLKKR